jgi:hypothetical protein
MAFNATHLLAQVRRMPEGEWFVALVNTRREPVGRARVRLAAAGRVEEWNCRTGEIREVPLVEDVGGLAWETDFGSLTERLFRVSRASSPAAEPAPALDHSAAAFARDIPGPFAYELDEPNVCVLDRARFRLGEDPAGEDDILRIDAAVRARLGWAARSGVMLQPWRRDRAPAEGPRLELRFAFQVAALPTELDLLLEQPERWAVTLNATAVSVSPRADAFIDVCFKRLPLPAHALKPGVNEVILTTLLREDTQLEAIYLLGGFGVLLRESTRVLTSLPEKFEAGDLTGQGLPFYGGVVTYLLPAPASAATLEVPSFAGACMKLRSGREQAGRSLGFSPHRASVQPSAEPVRLEVFLTRQNMFGPLHRLPLRQDFTGPDSFRTTGCGWSEAPRLFPSGLLAVPRYLIRS